mgnify:CR=1 FL=1
MAKKSVQEIKEISDAVKATLDAYGKQRDQGNSRSSI